MKKQWMVRALPEALTLASLSTSFTRSLCSSASSTATSSPSFAIKNVTKSNFDSVLSDLRRLVKEADFVAVDLEMTGVTSAQWRDSFKYDSFDVRYLKVKDSAEKFAVVQFGACPFRWDSAKQSLIAHPHNFYIFPRQEIAGDGSSYEFLCQTTSIDFLAKYQFDFNLCINEGISYLSRRQEDEALRRLRTAYEDELSGNLRNTTDEPLVRISDVLFTERMKNRISEWRDRLLLNRKGESSFSSHQSSNDSIHQFQTIFFKMRPAILLHGFTSHQLRLIHLVTEKHFPDLVFVRANNETPSVQHIVVYVDSDNDKGLLMKEVKDGFRKEAERKIEAAVGFRSIIDLLSSEKKLIVGHNCFLDMAHIYSKFFGPLPSTVEEYTSSIHKYFPYIIDTKLLLNSTVALRSIMKKGSTSLSKAFATLCPELASGLFDLGLKHHVRVEVQVDDLRSSKWNSGAKHEAGYDAFMTGCVFSQALSRLGLDLQLDSPFSNLVNNEKIQKQINVLYLSWINGVIVDLNTGKVTADSSYSMGLKLQSSKTFFSNIALVWGFLPSVKARMIRDCISKAFGPNSVSSVYHLDETAVFVQFTKEESVGKFLQLKETLERNSGPISVFHPLSTLLEGGNTCAATYEFYREICSSSVSEVLFANQVRAIGIKWKTEPITPEAKKVKTPEAVTSSGEENSCLNAAIENRESCNLDRLISELSGRHFEDDETSPVEAQLAK